jgi:hypothetical protein
VIDAIIIIPTRSIPKATTSDEKEKRIRKNGREPWTEEIDSVGFDLAKQERK